MSILIDRIAEAYSHTKTEIPGHGWFIAKPLNDHKEYTPISHRIRDAFRVLQCKSIAVHFKEDEL